MSTIDGGQATHVSYALASAFTQIVSGDKRLASELDLLSDWDQQRIACWNACVPATIQSCVHHEFCRVASRSPELEAVCSWDGILSYGELDDLSTRLAHKLVGLGVALEVIVPLCFEKSVWAIVAMLAVAKAGGAYLCVDPTYPAGRRDKLLQQVEAKYVLVSAQHSELFKVSGVEALVICSKTVNAYPRSDGNALSTPVRPENAAYVIFTSGSTGEPKGIVVEHRALCTSVREIGKALAVGEGSRVLQYAAYSFDVSVGDIFTTLTHGGCLCIPSAQDRRDHLARAIRTMNVNQACLTSTVASLLKPLDVPSLQTLTLGGEPASRENVATWADKVTLNNIYGPAECTIWCAVQRSLGAKQDESKIGTALGSRTWIVDAEDDKKLVPVGAVGELLIEGPILARGYLHDPGKTNMAFLIDPDWVHRFGSSTGRRFYKTGDLVRYDTDGTLLFIGRKDSQVKLRGQRVELGEVEYHLRKNIPERYLIVAELVTPSGQMSNARLAAFICFGDGFDVEQELNNISDATREHLRSLTDGLEERLRADLPTYMVPSIYIPLKNLPLSTSGKIDRKYLRRLASELSIEQLSALTTLRGAQKPPCTAMERRIAGLWADILSLELARIGANDSFLKMGGDSFAAMRLVTAARTCGVSLTVTQIFQFPQLPDMALAATIHNVEENDVVEPFELMGEKGFSEEILREVEQQCGLTRNLIEDIYPCTPVQEEMMLQSLTTGPSQFAQETVELSPDLDIDRYRAIWEIVAELNPILRTRISKTETSGLMQVVVREKIPWQSPNDLQEYRVKDEQMPVCAGARLARFAIYTEPQSRRGFFIFSMHHALFDGISLGLIFESVYQGYRGAELRASSPFQPFIKHLITTRKSNLSELFWLSKLTGFQAPTFPSFPTNEYRPSADSFSEHHIRFCKKASNITTSTIIRGSWAIVLASYTRSFEVIFGAYIAGRNAPVAGIESIAAATLANVPMRVLIKPNKPVRKFLQELQDQAIEMIPFEHMGVPNIAKLSADARAACQFQNMLVVQPHPGSPHTLNGGSFPGNIISGPRVDAAARKTFNPYGLLFECTITGDGTFVKTSFDANMLRPYDIHKVVADFECTLHHLCGESDEILMNPF